MLGIRTGTLSDDYTWQFTIEKVRREIQECTSIEAMRELSLETIILMEKQRRWFISQFKAHDDQPA